MLAAVLAQLPPIDDPNVLVGTSTADDAGVYKVNDEIALVQTVDFFTPIVDDPQTFGRIAAANALSDVYAMGARPVTALAIAAFPESGLDISVLADILRGGAEKAREAGIDVIGGHTVKDSEPKYGLAVTGLIHPERVIRNSTAKPDDVLVLTKPIGTGILTTALKRDLIDERDLDEAIESMQRLNRNACEVMVQFNAATAPGVGPVHAATDITGFGLIGHALELARGSGVGIQIHVHDVPLLNHALKLAERDCVPSGSKTNYAEALAAGVDFSAGLSAGQRSVLCDAQTSGGLLIAVDSQHASEFVAALRRADVAANKIGKTTRQQSYSVI